MSAPPPDSAKEKPEPAPKPQVVAPEKQLKPEQFVGEWKAQRQGATFQATFTADGAFTWSYEKGKDKQDVKGVFAVDENTLAMEPDTGGTMLAEIDFIGRTGFRFKMIGEAAGDSGLLFQKK
jgi:hypothetical protein